MKKVFLIGKIDPIFEQTQKFLSAHFSVQICVDNAAMLKSLLNLCEPDLFLFYQSEPSPERIAILREIRKLYPNKPLLCVDAPEDPTPFEDVLEGRAPRVLKAPVGDEDVLAAACDLLGLSYNRQAKTVRKKYRGGKPCVLAVDDVAFQLRTINELLKDDFDVMVATSAATAITTIARRLPDIILLDYEMPVCDGAQAMQMIREIDEAKDIPIVFLTAHDDMEHINSVLDLKPAGYLLKPVRGDVLIEEINKHIG